VAFVTPIWDNGKTNKNGPSVIDAQTSRLGPNHWIGVAEMKFTARFPAPPLGGDA